MKILMFQPGEYPYPMLRRQPFDLVLFLERTLKLQVYYSKTGSHIVLDSIAALSEEKQRQTRRVVRLYPRILELQLDAPERELRPSIRKLLAQGKGRDRDGAVSGLGEIRPADIIGAKKKARP